MNYGSQELINDAENIGIEISQNKADALKKYSELLISYNEKFNLTAITDPTEILIKHFLDSLYIGSLNLINSDSSLIDIGTGAGFPGLVIAICYEDCEVTLLETSSKRCSFLEQVKGKLHIENVNILNSRAEDAGKDSLYREKYDIACSRAVAEINVLSEYMLPFVSVGGHAVFYKSINADTELIEAENAISLFGGKYEYKKGYSLPFDMGERSLVVVSKEFETPSKYPRRAGIPSKRPMK